ncbi:mandelate racemase/muconate lactonizing enzyme family protein [Pseudomonas typographi]|uniref:Mandelate racemase/muconate lactonizing enzyme family protein n=1 Tax=Pseudomonas typographi TaxID=2715964 RepID=A0ABR7Z0E3_9PSED|nr:mandelate racemase/muconate lactonizing enzyme family protein [Pseudomonas typographi]MBD1552324.1 mandelate racemase/muconate lactonizing enzyme family protein [Pseudomonas typographi]MBD1589284.1 mandelate racemase/muconate lactonizing enzyme family protein [Pseudomonas typographi]MBD1598961.1 mandelate racemase/muconate lactonizing enzyme family protein [Pseudomonas typographi]
MKIERITPYLFNPRSGKNLLLVRVDTDTGLYGWGECYTTLHKERVVETFVHCIAPYLLGRQVHDIRHHWRILFDDLVIKRGSVDLSCAWSGIEIALWDIIGKQAGLPVYKLIGGRQRERIRLYANGWTNGCKTVDDICAAAVRTVAAGFSALKWDPYSGPWRTILPRGAMDAAVANVRAVRDAVGEGVDLLIDAHRRVGPQQSIEFARRIEPFNILQYEDPNLADNIDLVAQTRAHTRLPIVCGETFYSKEQFQGLLQASAADVINPDVCGCGGILASMELAAMAEPYAVGFSPHNHNSTVVGMAATAHVSMAVSNFLIAEYFVNFKDECNALARQPLEVEDGWLTLPDAPGLGVDIDTEELLRWPYEAFPLAALRHPAEE